MNIRGLALISSKAKVSILEDTLEKDNSIGIMLTETWLSDEISDAEIQMENFEIFRSDRISRQRGGAAIYLRKELHSKVFNAFSNSVVETLIVTCKTLKIVFVCAYRPPSTKNEEWTQAINNLNNQIEMVQSNGGYDTIIFGGDMNFPNLNWVEKLPKIDLNLCNQEEVFVNFMFTHNLLNYVDIPTRSDNILDLILTNDYDLISKTVV